MSDPVPSGDALPALRGDEVSYALLELVVRQRAVNLTIAKTLTLIMQPHSIERTHAADRIFDEVLANDDSIFAQAAILAESLGLKWPE